jgi:hypothetical protein
LEPPTVRPDYRRGEARQVAAVDADRKGGEVVLRVQAVGVRKRLEQYRVVVDEPRATRPKFWKFLSVLWDEGKTRHLCTSVVHEIMHDDLHGILAVRSRPDVRVRGEATVRAEQHRGRERGPLGSKAHVATRRTEATRRLGTVGANEEEALLFGRQGGLDRRKFVVDLEDYGRAVGTDAEPLQRERELE